MALELLPLRTLRLREVDAGDKMLQFRNMAKSTNDMDLLIEFHGKKKSVHNIDLHG